MWAAHIAGDGEMLNFRGLPTERLDREQLFSKLAASDLELREKCALIFAWGGMKIDHGKSAFASFDEWRYDVKRIQAGEVSRLEAYAALLAKRTPGMGPAFFTKLIYFFGRCAAKSSSSGGYIMDQWTARSVNLLSGEKVVALSSGMHWPKAQIDGVRLGKAVTAENGPDTYEAFCQFIDCLASKFECAPDFVEEVMFSHGGNSKGRWRLYVLENDI
ncbi:8-oxoguanine DNA glycosylase OGG fold protein [Rhizobium ruizarguesonis]|uniref:8-oxoguanine DNA glycosylase OGG fold protein n=1 Tax=Rhizobium ruizarguesonis TaxID=2081791 RepID=UPI0034DB69E9